MNLSVAVLLGATLVGASVAGTGVFIGSELRCSGYLASAAGAQTLERHTRFEEARAASEPQRSSNPTANPYTAAINNPEIAQIRAELARLEAEQTREKAVAKSQPNPFETQLSAAGCRPSLFGMLGPKI